MIERARAGYLGILGTVALGVAAVLGVYGRFVHPLPGLPWPLLLVPLGALLTVPLFPPSSWKGRLRPWKDPLTLGAYLLLAGLFFFLAFLLSLRGLNLLLHPPGLLGRLFFPLSLLAPLGRLLPAPPGDLLLALGLATAATLWGVVEAAWVRVVRVTLRSPRIPPGTERLRVVQISDLHLGLIHDLRFLHRLVRKIRLLKPDLLVSTGDLVDGSLEGQEDVADLIREIRPRLGALAVTGNHEFYAGLEEALAFHRRCGFRVLRDAAVRVGPLWVAGVDDPGGKYGPTAPRADEEGLLEGWGEGGRRPYVLFLKHRPVVRRGTLGRFDLMLSGHVHGGQVFPWNLLARSAYRYARGLKRLRGAGRGAFLYVSAGTGTWGPPVRLFAPPEVTVFDLFPAKRR